MTRVWKSIASCRVIAGDKSYTVEDIDGKSFYLVDELARLKGEAEMEWEIDGEVERFAVELDHAAVNGLHSYRTIGERKDV